MIERRRREGGVADIGKRGEEEEEYEAGTREVEGRVGKQGGEERNRTQGVDEERRRGGEAE